MPGRPAGLVVSFFENRLHKTLDSREAIQDAFAFYFFDNCCWRCASPFHHRPDCKEEQKPDVKKWAKRMQEVSPPSSDVLLKRFERKLRFEDRQGRP
jgi:hypothetical protein